MHGINKNSARLVTSRFMRSVVDGTSVYDILVLEIVCMRFGVGKSGRYPWNVTACPATCHYVVSLLHLRTDLSVESPELS